ncbi:MAG: Lon protease family protein [Acidobacteriota bacterium]
MGVARKLDPDSLYRRCDAGAWTFESTDELEDLAEIVGQPRAVDAIRFGIGIRQPGYNLFALGPPATGKHSIVRQFLAEKASAEPRPSDWCYVHNFDEPHRPIALELPPGRGIQLRDDLAQLLEELRVVLPAAFESDEYRARKQSIEEGLKNRQNKAFADLGDRARQRGIAFARTPVGFMFAPAEGERILPPDEFEKLPEPRRRQIESDTAALQEELRALAQEMPIWEKQSREEIKELNREVTTRAVGHLIGALRAKFADLPKVVAHLEALERDVINNASDFLSPSEASSPSPLALAFPTAPGSFRRYGVNLLVDHSRTRGAPVVDEQHPSHQNLVGGIEHIAQLGTLLTDFNLIKAGALHRSNGGYLVLDARQVLLQPYAWEGLKQTLRSGEITIESVGQMLGLASTVTLDPQPIPVRVKVVLIGERLLYYLLFQVDPDFGELFKVAADFDDEIERSPANDLLYARLIATLARREGLLPFDRQAVARAIEHSARLAGDAERLSARIGIVADVLREADYWSRLEKRQRTAAADVERAIDTQMYRANLFEERIRTAIARGTILIDTGGEKAGQVNGLSLVELGRYRFGRPSRITARVRLGRGEVIDIEREVEMGGPVHSKGVFILSGYLGARYALDRPLALSASLVFEQSYGAVEGDSASLAELAALISALAQAPIRQALAVTGSVNQQGQVQAVGGVNEKIEGFYRVCRAGGLTGDQGVVIPSSNVQHLMLHRDVIEAVAAGRFHIYPVETIDAALEILTGQPAGERDAGGAFPAGSINARVEDRLAALADRQREFRAETPVAPKRR